MARETRKTAILGDLQNLSATMELNKELLPDLEPFRLKFTGIVTQIVDAGKQQAAMRASKQEFSKQVRQLLTEGQQMADVIRTAVRAHFGPKSEKLAEFGLQPFRGRKAKAAAAEPTPTTPTAPDGAAPTVPAGPAPPAK